MVAERADVIDDGNRIADRRVPPAVDEHSLGHTEYVDNFFAFSQDPSATLSAATCVRFRAG